MGLKTKSPKNIQAPVAAALASIEEQKNPRVAHEADVNVDNVVVGNPEATPPKPPKPTSPAVVDPATPPPAELPQPEAPLTCSTVPTQIIDVEQAKEAAGTLCILRDVWDVSGCNQKDIVTPQF